MNYVRVYEVDRRLKTTFIVELDYNSPQLEAYYARSIKVAPSTKQRDTLCLYIQGPARKPYERLPMNHARKSCANYLENNTCNVLNVKDCANCTFYKPKDGRDFTKVDREILAYKKLKEQRTT